MNKKMELSINDAVSPHTLDEICEIIYSFRLHVFVKSEPDVIRSETGRDTFYTLLVYGREGAFAQLEKSLGSVGIECGPVVDFFYTAEEKKTIPQSFMETQTLASMCGKRIPIDDVQYRAGSHQEGYNSQISIFYADGSVMHIVGNDMMVQDT